MKEIGRVGFMDKPVPRPGPNDAVIQTTRALICTSDSHTVGGGIGPREDLTLGHEAVGVVQDVGSEVGNFQPGVPGALPGAITPDWGKRWPWSADVRNRAHCWAGCGVLQHQRMGFCRVFPRTEVYAKMAGLSAAVPDAMAFTAAACCPPVHGRGARQYPDWRDGSRALGRGRSGSMSTAGARLRGAGLIIGVEVGSPAAEARADIRRG